MFFSYFSIRTWLVVRKILKFGYTVNHSIKSVKSYNSYYPLLYYDNRPVLGIRDKGIVLILSLNIALKFKYIKLKGTYLPDLSGQRWEIYEMPHLNKRARIYRLYPIPYSESRQP